MGAVFPTAEPSDIDSEVLKDEERPVMIEDEKLPEPPPPPRRSARTKRRVTYSK